MNNGIKQRYLNCFGRNKAYRYLAECYHFILHKYHINRFQFYSSRINRSGKGFRKISVVFYASVPEVWNSFKTVYEEATKNPDIEAHILLLPIRAKTGEWVYQEEHVYEKVYPNYHKVYNEADKSWTPIEKYSPDYVFFERPYDDLLPDGYKSSVIIKYAKTCYIPYGFILTSSPQLLKTVLNENFLINLYLFFASWEGVGRYCEKLFLKYGNKNRKVVYLGYPRFDLRPPYREKEYETGITLMWTPRWTVSTNGIEDDSSETSFFRFKDSIIERSNKQKKESWIVRPHPLAFQNYISSGLMTEKEVEEYKKTLDRAENICLDENQDYLIGFQKADILIADFSSLVIEYFVMGKPVIFCGKINTLPLKELRDNVYVADTWEAVETILENLEQGIDPLKESRLSACKKIIGKQNSTIGSNIIRYIISDFNGKSDVRDEI